MLLNRFTGKYVQVKKTLISNCLKEINVKKFLVIIEYLFKTHGRRDILLDLVLLSKTGKWPALTALSKDKYFLWWPE